MTTQNRRKTKTPQRRDPSDVLNFSVDAQNSEFSFKQSMKLEETNSINDDSNMRASELFSESSVCKDSNTEKAETSALKLIHAILPSPSESQNNEVYRLYQEIRNICCSLDGMIEQYLQLHADSGFFNSLSSSNDSSPLSSSSCVSQQQTCSTFALQPTSQKLPLLLRTTTPTDTESTGLFLNTVANIESNLMPRAENVPMKRKTFRGTSDEENEVDCFFKPHEINNEVLLCSNFPEVQLSRELFQLMLLKSASSATRLIRLLMKNFFSQKVLAASSLSGEGYYKQKLNPRVVASIKDFIKRRHPKLKNGSINLCMTDVCVQARRVCRSKLPRLRGSSAAVDVT